MPRSIVRDPRQAGKRIVLGAGERYAQSDAVFSRGLPSLLLWAALATACGGTSVTELAGPDVVRCEVTFAPAAEHVPSAGSRTTIAVRTTRECTWTAKSEAGWIQVAPSSGQGEATVTLT